MRIIIFIVNISVFLIAGLLHSQNVRDDISKSNHDIYTELINKNLDVLENKFVLLGKEKIYCVGIGGDRNNADFLYKAIKQKFYNFRIISEADSSGSDYKVFFENVKFRTAYNKVSGSVFKNRIVERQIELSYKCTVKSKGNDSLVFNNSIHDINKDEFYLDKIDEVEKGDYDFLKGTLPAGSLFERLLIPGIVVLASAATIILFFVIRSK
jgi:hypothetical protein